LGGQEVLSLCNTYRKEGIARPLLLVVRMWCWWQGQCFGSSPAPHVIVRRLTIWHRSLSAHHGENCEHIWSHQEGSRALTADVAPASQPSAARAMIRPSGSLLYIHTDNSAMQQSICSLFKAHRSPQKMILSSLFYSPSHLGTSTRTRLQQPCRTEANCSPTVCRRPETVRCRKMSMYQELLQRR
jgi:hypothetical protein